MCGRMNITEDPVTQWLWEHFNLSFHVESNPDLRPTQKVAAMTWENDEFCQLDTTWGIKPSWSKKYLINAQGETVHRKKTFQAAFVHRRCLVPCNGWYEWRDEGGSRKQRYYFCRTDGAPLLMAGLWFAHVQAPQLVTLTTKPNSQCAEFHQRMPVIIAPQQAQAWLRAEVTQAREMLLVENDLALAVELS